MSIATSVPRKTLGDLAEARLKTLSGVTVYRGEVPGEPPVIQSGGRPDASGRVAPYVVLWPGAGRPSAEQDAADSRADLEWPFQLTCVAGYSADCERLVDRVDALIYRWAPTLAGFGFGSCKPPLGFDPGPIRKDEQVKPPRFYLPLQYVLPVTT